MPARDHTASVRAKTWVRRTLVAAALVIAAAPAALSRSDASLTVIVKNLRSDAGMVHVAIWQGPDGFADGDYSLAQMREPANGQEQRIVFEGLAPGHYALAALHDENGNGEFDRTWLGLPGEGLGFSNGAWIEAFGPPSFENAAIKVMDNETSTVIELRY